MKKTIILSIAFVCIALGISLSSYLAMRENISSMAVANAEALTGVEQPDVADCISDPDFNCEALHPTDPSKDKLRLRARW